MKNCVMCRLEKLKSVAHPKVGTSPLPTALPKFIKKAGKLPQTKVSYVFLILLNGT